MLSECDYIINCDGVLPINFLLQKDVKRGESCIKKKSSEIKDKKNIIREQNKIETDLSHNKIIIFNLVECVSYM